MTPQRAGEAAGAQVGDFPPPDTPEQNCPSGGPLRRSTGYAQKQAPAAHGERSRGREAKDLAAIRAGYSPNAAEMRRGP